MSYIKRTLSSLKYEKIIWKYFSVQCFPITERADMGKPKYSEDNLPQRHFVYNKSHTDWSGIKPGPLRWQPVTNHLSHGTVW